MATLRALSLTQLVEEMTAAGIRIKASWRREYRLFMGWAPSLGLFVNNSEISAEDIGVDLNRSKGRRCRKDDGTDVGLRAIGIKREGVSQLYDNFHVAHAVAGANRRGGEALDNLGRSFADEVGISDGEIPGPIGTIDLRPEHSRPVLDHDHG